jgi:hypothetical protein
MEIEKSALKLLGAQKTKNNNQGNTEQKEQQ